MKPIYLLGLLLFAAACSSSTEDIDIQGPALNVAQRAASANGAMISPDKPTSQMTADERMAFTQKVLQHQLDNQLMLFPSADPAPKVAKYAFGGEEAYALGVKINVEFKGATFGREKSLAELAQQADALFAAAAQSPEAWKQEQEIAALMLLRLVRDGSAEARRLAPRYLNLLLDREYRDALLLANGLRLVNGSAAARDKVRSIARTSLADMAGTRGTDGATALAARTAQPGEANLGEMLDAYLAKRQQQALEVL